LPNLTPRRFLQSSNAFVRIAAVTALLVAGAASLPAQSVSLAGLYGVDTGVNSSSANFVAVQMDSAKNLYLLLDEGDGVRVLKLNPAGTTVLDSIHLGAAGDHGVALALASTGTVYVTGTAGSGQLAATGGAALNFPGAQSSFVAGLTSALTESFLTSTGGNLASATGLAVNSGAVYVTGTIQSNTLPVTGNAIVSAFPTASTSTGFVETFNSTGSTLSFATYLGGPNGNTAPQAITADASGNIFVTGSDTATGYPTVNGIQPELVGTSDLFLTKFSAAAGIVWSTLLGSTGGTVSGNAIALAATGTVYVGVNATALGLPVTNSLAPAPAASNSAMIMNFAANGSSVNFSTVLGDGALRALALDSHGTIYATGAIHDPAAWPLPNDVQHVGTAFVTAISSTGALLYGTRLGGIEAYASNTPQSTTSGNGIAIAADGTVAIAGTWTALTATSGWLPESLDLPMVNAPNAALPGTLTAATASSACQTASAVCSVGYAAVLAPASTAEVSLSVDTVPNLTVRNLGGAAFTVTSVSATGYTTLTDCTSAGSLASGAACNLLLTGNGPGSVTVNTSAGAATFPITAAALTAAQNTVALQPKEAVFAAVGASASAPQTVVVSNLTGESQIVAPNGTALNAFSLQDGTCTGNTPGSSDYVLPANSTCTLLATFYDSATMVSQDGANQGFVTAQINSAPVNAVEFYSYKLAEANSQAGPSEVIASTSSIDFGTNYLGGPQAPRSVLLTNAGSSDVTLAFVGTPAADPNFVVTDMCPVSLPAYSSCVIAISYQATVTSVDSTTLALPNGQTLTLTGEELQQPGAGGLTVNPSISVTPSSLTFGAVGVGDSTTTLAVTVSNSSGSAVAITLAISANFSQTNTCAGFVPANGSCVVQVTFHPTALGVLHGQLAITPSGNSAADVALTGGGTNTVNFGAIELGTESTQWISLGAFEGNVTATVEGPFQVVVVNGYSYTAPPAITFSSSSTGSCTSNCYVGARAVPSAGGSQSGTLTISEQGESAVTYPLTAAALPQSSVALSSYSLGFGAVSVGSASAPQLVSIVNPSNAAVTVTSVTPSANFSVTTNCGSSLAGGASCVAAVSFVPATIGTLNGTLSVAAAGKTIATQLTGNGAANPASLSFSPPSLYFLSPSGASSQKITVANTGATSVTVTQIYAPGGAFYAQTNTCGTLAASGMSGSTCVVTVAVTSVPAGLNATQPLTLLVTAGGNSYSYQIPVTALPSGLGLDSASLQVFPAALEFATEAVGQASGAENLTVTNNSGSTQTVNVTAPAQFSVDNTTCATLSAGASCTIPVRFLPFSAGNITGQIQIQGTGTILKVAANGFGLAATQIAAPAYPPLLEPISLSPNPQGDGTTQLMQITNAGSSPLLISQITATNVIVGNTCTAPVAASASCTVTLQTTVEDACGDGCGPYTVDVPLTVFSNAASSPDNYTILQTESGTNGATSLPGFNVTSASLTFPQTALGAKATKTFEVQSVNSATLTLAITTSGDFSQANNCNGTLAGYQGGSYPYCTITVTFSPSVAGFRAGTLQVATNAGLQTVTLAGNGPTASGPVATSTTLSSSATSVPQGQSVTLTAKVAPNTGSGTPTGSVTFSSGTVTIATVPLTSGVAMYTASTAGIASGRYPVIAKYSGDANNKASTSPALTITVTSALDATTTTLTANPQTVSAGSPVTLTATVTRTGATGTPGGTVAFYYGSVELGSATLSSGTAHLTATTNGVPAGKYSITAHSLGDSADAPSTSPAVTVTVQ
jgi:hypothetical protein